MKEADAEDIIGELSMLRSKDDSGFWLEQWGRLQCCFFFFLKQVQEETDTLVHSEAEGEWEGRLLFWPFDYVGLKILVI